MSKYHDPPTTSWSLPLRPQSPASPESHSQSVNACANSILFLAPYQILQLTHTPPRPPQRHLLFFRRPQGAAAAGSAGSHHADVRREPGGFADSAVLPERRHLRGGESDDSYERSCLSGPFPLPSQYSEERKLTEASFFSTL